MALGTSVLMQWFALLNFISAFFLAPLALLAWTRKDRLQLGGFALALTGMAVYGFGLALESLRATLATAWVWSRVQYLAIPVRSDAVLDTRVNARYYKRRPLTPEVDVEVSVNV